MREKHKRHIITLQKEFSRRIKEKYVKGQEEHGGNLWEKEGLLDEAINEVVDLSIYLLTLKCQTQKMLKSSFTGKKPTK